MNADVLPISISRHCVGLRLQTCDELPSSKKAKSHSTLVPIFGDTIHLLYKIIPRVASQTKVTL